MMCLNDLIVGKRKGPLGGFAPLLHTKTTSKPSETAIHCFIKFPVFWGQLYCHDLG